MYSSENVFQTTYETNDVMYDMTVTSTSYVNTCSELLQKKKRKLQFCNVTINRQT